MVAKGLKDYAAEKGMKVSNGVAYGVIGGYMVTLKEGYGIKEVSVSGAFTDECVRKVTQFLQTPGAKKEYRIADFTVLREAIVLEITDTVGTMKKIKALLDFLPNFFAIIGALIGFLSVKGYEKLGGKVCKAKMPIILVATLLGAIFGQFAGDVAYIMVAWECSVVDAVFSFFYLFQDPEYAEFVSTSALIQQWVHFLLYQVQLVYLKRHLKKIKMLHLLQQFLNKRENSSAILKLAGLFLFIDS